MSYARRTLVIVLVVAGFSCTPYGGARRFEVISTPSGADVYLIPRLDAETNGWLRMPRAELLRRVVAGDLSAYRQGATPLRVVGEEMVYLLVVATDNSVTSQLIQPEPGERVTVTLR